MSHAFNACINAMSCTIFKTSNGLETRQIFPALLLNMFKSNTKTKQKPLFTELELSGFECLAKFVLQLQHTLINSNNNLKSNQG